MADSEAKTHTEVFSSIYAKNAWFAGSGYGSSEAYNRDAYVPFVIGFCLQHKITSVLDLGSGDWQSAHLIYAHLPSVSYVGVDCVPQVVTAVAARFGSSSPSRSFQCLDFSQSANVAKLPSADLVILKDVLQHWPADDIMRFLDALLDEARRRGTYPRILVCNCCQQGDGDTGLGCWRQLAANAWPLNKYGARPLFRYHTKEVSLIVP